MEDKLSQVIKHDRQGDEPQETFDIVNASQEQGLREYRLGRADELGVCSGYVFMLCST